VTSTTIPLTPTGLIAVASSVLEAGGYQIIREGFPEWNTTSTRLFEDKYNVVGIAVFTTISDLLSSWADLQGALVDAISRHVGQVEGKSWDGYLVLLTTSISPSSDVEIEDLRYNTTRLRKLVATGEDISSAQDVERLLRSLLPLRSEHGSIGVGSILDLLPGLLAEQEINKKTTEILVKSFIEHGPLMEELHRHRRSQ